MGRLARIVVPGRAHHVTQPGNRRELILFEEGDQSIFLGKWKPYTYDTASNVVTVTLPNGIVSTSHYDQLNRLTSLTSQVSSYTYQLLQTGNRTGSSELNGRTLTWNYNGVYQLTEQTHLSQWLLHKDGLPEALKKPCVYLGTWYFSYRSRT